MVLVSQRRLGRLLSPYGPTQSGVGFLRRGVGGGCGIPSRRTPVGARFRAVSVISIERLSSDPLAALRELAAGEAQLDRLRREHVAAARAGGASWGEVGRALGVSEDAVLEYYFADARRDLAENAGTNDGDLSEEQAMELAVAEVRAVRGSMHAI